jgi:hypothetical protein
MSEKPIGPLRRRMIDMTVRNFVVGSRTPSAPPRPLGGAEGKRLTSHTHHERLYGPCVSGTRLDFDRPRRIRPPHCDGSSDRRRLTRTQA